MRRVSLFAAAGLCCASPAMAEECLPEFVDNSETVNVANVQVGVGEYAQQNFGVRVRNAGNGNGNCRGTIRFTRLGGAATIDIPPYFLRSGATVLQILPEGSTPTIDSELLVPSAPVGLQGRNVPFQLTVPSEWGLKAGNFGEQIELTLVDQSGNAVDTLLLTVNISIPEAVALRVVGATGDGDLARINLGNISSTATTISDPFGVRVWSTSGYRVVLSSDNQGQLVHDGNLDRFPYRMYFDGRAVNLIGGDNFVFPDHTRSLGRVHPLRIQAGPTRARAGYYEDRVTVTVTPV